MPLFVFSIYYNIYLTPSWPESIIMQVRGIGRNGQNHKSAVISENDEKKVMERKTTDGRRG
jgi:hypothetical protein